MNGCCALHNYAPVTDSSKLLLHTRLQAADQAIGLLTEEVCNIFVSVS